MALIIAIVNQKGGVGKTTTSVNLAAYLGLRGKKTLLIDLDPQGNTSSGVGLDKNSLENTSYDMLINETELKDCVVPTEFKNLHIVGTNIDLAGAEVELVNLEERENRLKNALHDKCSDYDFVIIDCPPSLGLLTLNALTAADTVIITLQAEYYALEGLSQLVETINLVRSSLNTKLGIFGILITMYDGRTQLARLVEEEIRTHFGEKLFKTRIPRNIKLSEAPSYGKPICYYNKISKGGMAYMQLAKEVVARAKEYN